MDPVAGVDPHLDTFEMVLIDSIDRILDGDRYDNDPDGWRQALATLERFGIGTVGIENASGYGQAFAQLLVAAGIGVVDVPTRVTARERRRDGAGKTDMVDARAAARAVLAGKANQWRHTPELEALRGLTHRRETLVKTQTREINQLRARLIELDPPTAARLGRLRSRRAFTELAHLDKQPDKTKEIIAQVIRDIANDCVTRLSRIRDLEQQIRINMPEAGQRLINQIDGCGIITAAILLSEIAGTDGFETEARFAKWAGIAPLDASSGRTQDHHRLSRGGNRQANRAIHIICVTQYRQGGEAHQYITRRRQQGQSHRNAIRACKRHITRRVWKTLQTN